MKRLLLQGLLAFLLLAGQHSALVHSVWHLHDHLPAHVQHDETGASHDHGDEHSSQSRLCDLHAAFDMLLAGGCGVASSPLAVIAGEFLSPGDFAWRAAHRAVTPPSRAPPSQS